jgi:hypothetical protein
METSDISLKTFISFKIRQILREEDKLDRMRKNIDKQKMKVDRFKKNLFFNLKIQLKKNKKNLICIVK